jgi:fibronectin type 3 domain-containing protein
VSGAVKYKIYRSVTLDGAYLEIGESTTLSYTNTGLTPATSYYYKITALDVDGNESSKSTAGDAATKSNDSSLSAPTGLVASALSTSSIAISWNNVSGAAKYKIYRSPNDGAYLEIGESATLSYTNTGLTPVMSYYYKVTAIDASGNESSKSGSASATTKSATENKPSTPLGVTATAESSSSISVSWNVVTGASTYKVYRSTNSSGVYVGIGETPDTGYIDTGLQAATKYYYEVSAVDSSGLESDKSLWDDATTKSATSSTLPAPSGIAATAESSSSINISWNAVTGASKYKVYRSTSLSGAYMGIGETTDTWYTDTGLQAATAYYYEVSAVDSSGIESDKAGPRYVQTK